jgi:hypothetical protein
MKTLYCPNCGTMIATSGRFCPECGARLPADKPASPPAANTGDTVVMPQPPTPPPAAPSSTTPPPPVPPTMPLGGGALPPVPPAPRSNTGLFISLLLIMGVLVSVGCAAVVMVVLTYTAPTSSVEIVTPQEVVTAVSPIPTPVAPLGGGEVLFREQFTDPASSVFGESESAVSRFAFVDGGYQIDLFEPEYVAWWTIKEDLSDVLISTDVFFSPGTRNVAAAIVFHYQDDDNFYLFSVSDDGYYTLELQFAGSWTSLIDWTSSPEIDAVRNELQVETRGNQIVLYVNGVRLEATSDVAFTSGDVGIANVSFSEAPTSVRFESLIVERSR